MANLTQTAANVALGVSTTNPRIQPVTYGESITQGMPIYKSSTDSKYYQCDADTVDTGRADGIALTPGAADGIGVMVSGKDAYVNLGATLTVGETYCVSATKGAICPIADLASGDFVCILGIARTTSLIQTVFAFTGIAKA